MKHLIWSAGILSMVACFAASLHAQNWRPKSLNIAYFGELITHPGVNVGVTFEIKAWEHGRLKKNATAKRIGYAINLTPSLGFYHHKDYQTGFFSVPHLSLERKNERGAYHALDIGAGYLRTRVPNVYTLNPDRDIVKLGTGYNYFVTSYGIVFGRDLSRAKDIPIDWYLKPQVMYATPNVPNGVLYFVLEAGLKYTLKGAKKK